MKYFFYLALLIASFLIIGCNNDKNPEEPVTILEEDYLVGKWMIYQAMRDEEETLSLDRAEIFFTNKDSLISNLFDANVKIPYQFSDNNLTVNSSKRDYDFDVIPIGKDSILIDGVVGRSEMKMYFLKLK